MQFIYQNQPIVLKPGVPAGYENHHLHGTHTLSLVLPKATLFLQEIQLGEVFLQYLLLELAADTHCECRLPCSGSVIWICMRGYGFLEDSILLPEGSYHQFLHRDAWVRISATEKMVTAFLVLHLYTLTPGTPQHLTPSFVPPQMLDAAIQLIQTSYFPEPLPFHIRLAQKIGQLVLLQALPDHAAPTALPFPDIAAIHAARNLIAERFQHPLSLADISRHTGLNREKLRTGFKTLYGTTVAAFIRQCRLDHAREELVYTQKPIKQIARIAGYRNPSNFCSACKQLFGKSPGEIRKEGERWGF